MPTSVLISILSMFATPFGALINKFIGIGAASVITWAVAKGAPKDSVTVIVSDIAVAVSTLISGFAHTQGVTIPVINNSDNGVIVVPATSDAKAKAVNSPLK